MKRVTLAASIAVLLVNSGWSADDVVPGNEVVPAVEVTSELVDIKLEVDDVGPVAGELEITTLSVESTAEVTTATDDLIATTGIVDDGVVQTLGGEVTVEDPSAMAYSTMNGDIAPNQRNLEMSTTALPSLNSLLGNDTLRGEHRDQFRIQRARETTTPKKFGLLSLFRKSTKSEAQIQTVSQQTKSRAQQQARIDRLRDEALRTGDRTKLAEADRLERSLQPAGIARVK